MRIALYMDTRAIGGAERYFRDLCAGLAEAEHDVHVLTPDGVLVAYLGPVHDDITLHLTGERVVYAGGVAGNLLRSLAPARRVRSLLNHIRPDLVHLCNGGYPGAHTCRAAVFASRKPRIMTINNRAQERRSRLRLVDATLDGLLWRTLSAVICPSRATAARLEQCRTAPPSLIHVIPYGIGDSHPASHEVDELRARHAPNGELLVGMVAAPDDDGNHAVNKGHDVLLDALTRTERDDIRVVMIGHDPGPLVTTSLSGTRFASRVDVVAGFREVAPYMAAFDVLAVPSRRNEALPLVIIEAMAAATPVVGAALSGIPEAVRDGETGHTFPPGDASALAHHLRSYAEDRRRLIALGQRARQVYEQEFSRRQMIKATVELYNGVLQAGPAMLPGSGG